MEKKAYKKIEEKNQEPRYEEVEILGERYHNAWCKPVSLIKYKDGKLEEYPTELLFIEK